MSIVDSLTLQSELKELSEEMKNLVASAKQINEFVLSDEFLTKPKKFRKLLSDFQSRISIFITTAESVMAQHYPQQPLSQAPLTTAPENINVAAEQANIEQKILDLLKNQKKPAFSIEKALVVVTSIVACALAVEKGFLPPTALAGAVAAGAILPFLPQIKEALTLKKEERKEEAPEEMMLEEWVNDRLAEIRRKYRSARFLMRIQMQSKLTLPQYGLPGMDDALFDRKKYLEETLPDEIQHTINSIVVMCRKSVWYRRQVLHAVMAQIRTVGK